MKKITKEFILQKVDSRQIFERYIPYHFLKGRQLQDGKNFQNPLPGRRQQKTPSFNIFLNGKSGEYRYKDFQTGDNGDCFDFVMKMHQITFPETLKKIAEDFNIDTENRQPRPNPPITKAVTKPFGINKRKFTEADLTYWKRYGIPENVLKHYGVASVESFSTSNKNNQPFTVKSSSEKLIFSYLNGENGYKIYQPKGEHKYRFQQLGEKEPDFIFGEKQLPEKGETVFITGGEKDVMTLAANGYHAVSMNSETAGMSDALAAELKRRFGRVVVLYDKDETGMRESEKLCTQHCFLRMVLPEMPDGGKDVSDYFALGGSREQFRELVNAVLSKAPENPEKEDKVIFTAEELVAMENTDMEYLLKPLIPKIGVGVLVGMPDIGKSQFLRQFAIFTASLFTSFLGFELSPENRSAIYVATEDYINSIASLIKRQFKGLGETANRNLKFIIAETMDEPELIEKLDEQLTLTPSSLVVIDNPNDLATFDDNNNNMAMRKMAQKYSKLAKRHSCFFLLAHHINKAAYRQKPGQEHIQGGSGLAQKVRVALQLTDAGGTLRYLTVVKGNYCPKKYKEMSFVLRFSEDDMLFENTGSTIPTKDINKKMDNDDFDEDSDEKVDSNELSELAKDILQDKPMRRVDILNKIVDETGVSWETAGRRLKRMYEEGIVEKNAKRLYFFKRPNQDTPQFDFPTEAA